MSLKEIYHNKWTKLIIRSALYLLWVIWLENYWFLIGLIVLFDFHITKKVKWLFWKKEYKTGEKKNVFLDWLDALIFAVVVVSFINTFFFRAFEIPSSSMESSLYTGDHLFVSKLTYGPRIPQTPLTIPFTHNQFLGKESYSTLLTNEYRRLKGFRNVEAGDIVVFNFPHGDTVLTKAPADDYYAVSRMFGRKTAISNWGPIVVRPVDKTDHYVKRCVAVAGDTLSIRNGRVYINSKPQTVWSGLQSTYRVKTKGQPFGSHFIDDLGLNLSELSYNPQQSIYPDLALTEAMLEKVKKNPLLESIEENIDVYPPDAPDSDLLLFPYTEKTHWTRDNYGPIWIPKKGTTIELNIDNIALYKRIIQVYEHNSLDIKGEDIYINAKKATSYTFKQNYYFMMGDNRHNSLDSRYWGFVPEDHIVGSPFIIWFSKDRDRDFPESIRWKRFFKFV